MKVERIAEDRVCVEFRSGAQVTFRPVGKYVEIVSYSGYTEPLQWRQVTKARQAALAEFSKEVADAH